MSNLVSNCRHPGLPSKLGAEMAAAIGTPSAWAKPDWRRSGGWSSSVGKPFSFVIEVEVGVEA